MLVPEITNDPIPKFITGQLVFKLRQFSEEEFNTVLEKDKMQKNACINKIHTKVWKTRKFYN